jgi:sugar-specific transcriptional regulator TrmB
MYYKNDDQIRAIAQMRFMQPPLTKSLTATQTFNDYGLGKVGLEGSEVLVRLGLSSRQARVYLALLKLGNARARIIAALAGVPRQEVYGLLLELQQMGIVRQNLSTPVSYTALPFSETIKFLLEQKTHELVLISHKADRLIDKIDQPINFVVTEPPKPCFGEVCEGERGKKYRSAIECTQSSIHTLVSWARFKQLCYYYEKQLLDLLKNDIEISIVTEKPPSYSLPKWVKPTIQRYPNFKLKIQPTPPEAAIMIFDDSQLALAFNPNIRLTKGPDLWTSHPSLLASYRAFFLAVWEKTEGTQHQ